MFLFTGDIAYNIRLNNRKLTDSDVMNAIETACAAPFVRSLSDGINTEVKAVSYTHLNQDTGSSHEAGAY